MERLTNSDKEIPTLVDNEKYWLQVYFKLKDIEDLIPDMDKAISEKVETFLDKSGDQPYAHMNEGYVVVVEMTGEMDATDAISDYLRKRTELMY